ncbi:unnamed protein product [Cuscuta campestris]|uniref:Uncharacterized protein n=1 Tax=Cuscuta campestris TaxID=132261 RepID=A0A484NGQ2_9ASTE|nr:unnamed protein product [Cuscuta campestris]
MEFPESLSRKVWIIRSEKDFHSACRTYKALNIGLKCAFSPVLPRERVEKLLAANIASSNIDVQVLEVEGLPEEGPKEEGPKEESQLDFLANCFTSGCIFLLAAASTAVVLGLLTLASKELRITVRLPAIRVGPLRVKLYSFRPNLNRRFLFLDIFKKNKK